ncbi:MAG: zinc-binding dehydrogenase, partial [Bacillota bacterium]|nr:zinc-binding dehydrogenase [Bacillota bacterium]
DSRVYCTQCPHCQSGQVNRCCSLGFLGEVCDGGFAEYALLEEHQLFKLPAGIAPEQAALLEPLSVALHIWEKAKRVSQKRLAIVGAGPIGQLVTQVSAALSDTEILIVEPSPARRSAAKNLGAHRAISPDETEQYTDWADCVIEAVGKTAALESAFNLASIGSTVVLAGLFEETFGGDMNLVTEKELHVCGVNGFTTQNMADAIALTHKKTLDPSAVISQRFPLRETRQAFETMNDAGRCPGKVLVLP